MRICKPQLPTPRQLFAFRAGLKLPGLKLYCSLFPRQRLICYSIERLHSTITYFTSQEAEETAYDKLEAFHNFRSIGKSTVSILQFLRHLVSHI